MSLNQEIIAALKKEGCNIVGFADIRELPAEHTKGLPSAIIMATTYAPKALWDKLNDTQKQAIQEDWGKGDPLERYNKAVKALLKENKYKRNTTYSSMQLTYKTLATIAGIGWIGRCALLVTKAQGPAVRFTAVLTNAPLECGTPITTSQCITDCTTCQTSCPANAIKGGQWERGIHRDQFFDVEACKSGRSKCDAVCIANCPYTMKGNLFT